jgi:hypothetical protein
LARPKSAMRAVGIAAPLLFERLERLERTEPSLPPLPPERAPPGPPPRPGPVSTRVSRMFSSLRSRCAIGGSCECRYASPEATSVAQASAEGSP